MTDLTEQWKKGELLDEEDYYIKWKDSEVFTATFVDFMNRKMFQRMTLEFEELPTEHYLSVLAKVPSYEQWQEYKNANDSMFDTIKMLNKDNGKLEKENTKLKELLKECELWFTGVVGNMNDKNVGEHNRKLPIGNFEHAFKVFSQKINQALGEE